VEIFYSKSKPDNFVSIIQLKQGTVKLTTKMAAQILVLLNFGFNSVMKKILLFRHFK